MLILSRRIGESVMINDDIEIFVTSYSSGQVRVGIDAPDEYEILRKELWDKDKKDEQERNS